MKNWEVVTDTLTLLDLNDISNLSQHHPIIEK